MQAKISKWGNSLGLRLPKNITDQLNLTEGSQVSISKNDQQIIIEPIVRDLTMEELLSGMSSEGIMEQYHRTTPVGKERFWKDQN